MPHTVLRGLTRARGATVLRLVSGAVREVYAADRRGTVVAFCLQVLGALAGLGTVVAAKAAFDALLGEPDTTLGPVAALLLLLLAFMTALSGSVGALQGLQQRLLGERVAQRVWERVLKAAAAADLITYESTGFATQLDRVQQNALSRPFEVTTNLLGLAGSLLGVGTMSVVLVGIEPLLLPLLLAAGVPAVLLSRWASRTEFGFVLRATPPFRRRSYVRRLLVDRAYAAELRAFASTGRLRQRHSDLGAEYLSELRRQVRIRQLIAVLTTLGVGVALAGALLAIVELVARGRIGLPEAGAAAIAVRMLSGQLTTAFSSIGGLLEATPFLGDLESFVQSVPPPASAGRRMRLSRGLALSGVSFRYPDQSRPAVERVDLEIRAGEVVALVGENGSGKTTLAKIVAGLYRAPQKESLSHGTEGDPCPHRMSGPARSRRDLPGLRPLSDDSAREHHHE